MRLNNYKSDTCEPLSRAWKMNKLYLRSLVRFDYPGKPMPSNMLKGVNSIGFWDIKIPQNWGLDWHRNEGIEITYLETGSVSLSTEKNHDVQLMDNHLTIMRPWQLHKLGNPNIGVGRLYWVIIDVEIRNPHQSWKWPDWIILSDKDLEELTSILRQNEKVIWRSHPKISSCFQQLGKAVMSDDPCDVESELTILINRLLLNILYMFREGDIALDRNLIQRKRTVELFLAELPEHIDKAWTLESMAEYCNLGATRFVHFCKHITNKTPMRFLNHLRLSEAAKILENNSETSIKDVAYDCGYTSSQYFATQFKKRYGCSPKYFKKMLSFSN